MNILVINGPNLNLLGTREPEIYGTETLEELMMWLETNPISSGHAFKFFQSNHEGDIIDQIHESMNLFDGIILNPGALTHYSYALRDAIASVHIPAVEVHLSNINAREDFRKISVIKDQCISQISDFGKHVYTEGIKTLVNQL